MRVLEPPFFTDKGERNRGVYSQTARLQDRALRYRIRTFGMLRQLSPSVLSRATCRLTRVARLPNRACLSSSRSLSTDVDKQENTEPSPPPVGGPPSFVQESLLGVGQVIFLGNATCGAMVLGALGYADPWLGSLAALGTVTATATARIAGLDSGAISAGLMGYNGCLVGCAFSVFLGQPAWDPMTAIATVAGAAVTAPLAAALTPVCSSVPQFTLAFNIATLSALAFVKPLAGAAAVTDPSIISAMQWALSPLVGISQIFVVNDAVSGAMLLGAIAFYSPGAAAHTLVGSCVGMGTALACGAPAADIVAGLWGFNPALTALAVSVFFVPNASSYALATGGAAATAMLFGGVKGTMAGVLGVPALTLPFCAAAIGCHLLGQSGKMGLRLAGSPHSPEKNVP